jgi:DNA-binding NarL/FixJ family response regulator
VGGTARGGRPIGVLLADDHAMFRQALAGILVSRGDMEVVAGVPNDEDAPRLARELSPDVVVAEVRRPVGRAREALHAMRSFPDPPKVVVCTAIESPRYARALASAGASAYLLKHEPAERLVDAVRVAALGPGVGDAAARMPRPLPEESGEGTDGVLSARELEILLLVARGLSNGRVASSLHLAPSTVKRHLANVYGKMGVNSRGQASREALMRDWIAIEEITGARREGTVDCEKSAS